MSSLYDPIQVADLRLKNCICMAPMARARNNIDRTPTPMMAEYYAQRATAGLIVTEANSVSPMSQSRPHAAAHYLDAQTAGWAMVAERVHEASGTIFQQLYHLGRKSDPSRMPDALAPIAPSAIAASGQIAGENGPIPFSKPRAIETEEIPTIVDEFRQAAIRAKQAGMDGVEVHGANAYLIDQFLKSNTNHRTDGYGGLANNRCRFLFEVVDAVSSVFGPDRVGVRVSPHSRGDGIGDPDLPALYTCMAKGLASREIAYLHLVEAETPGLPQSPAENTPAILPIVREFFPGTLIVCGGYTRESAEQIINDARADMVAFATLYISNPDLVARFQNNSPLAQGDKSTFLNGSAKGYIDYPML
ncbi:MAG: alkene reductase [Rhodospirillaceae bacterium]